MPPRFGPQSLYKNIVATQEKVDKRYVELPVSQSVTESSNGIEGAQSGFLARGSGIGTLIYVPYTETGKRQERALTTVQSAVGPITDFKVSPAFPKQISVAGEGSKIQIFGDVCDNENPSLLSTIESTQRPLGLAYHTHAESLLSAMTQETVNVYDLNDPSKAAYTITNSKPLSSLTWTIDGSSLVIGSKDGYIRVQDPRNSASGLSISAHDGINKPVQVASVDANHVFSTGFSKMRDRELCLFDLRNFQKPVNKVRLDTSTGVLFPVVDHSRKLVYLAGRGDVTLRWTEPLSNIPNMGMATSPVSAPITGMALAHSSCLDVMHTEIGRLLIMSASSSEVSPVSMTVPRRQYVDFHSELFPPMFDETYATSASKWINGSDDTRDYFIVSPGKPGPTNSQGHKVTTSTEPKQEKSADETVIPKTEPVPAISTSKPVASDSTPSVPAYANGNKELKPKETTDKYPNSENKPESKPDDTPSRASTISKAVPSEVRQLEAKEPVVASKSDPKNADNTTHNEEKPIRWSRKFVAGKKPLKPDYEGLVETSSMLSPNVHLIKANPSYFFIPQPGPGGRLGFHRMSAKGRLPTHLEAFSSGVELMNFDIDPYNDSKVIVAGKDGILRMFEVPSEPRQAESDTVGLPDLGPSSSLGDGMNTIQTLSFNPVAKDILLTVSDDLGSTYLRIWDLSTETVVHKSKIPGGPVFACAWDPNGNKVAFTSKDKKLRILDPRKPEEVTEGPCHESTRVANVTWANMDIIITTGFTRTSNREVTIHKMDNDNHLVKPIGNKFLDISPAPLFSFFDYDTEILYVWARGERTVHCFEVNLEEGNKPIGQISSSTLLTSLPAFEAGSIQGGLSFLPKSEVDITKVEISRALRVGPREVEIVSFSIPRARTEFFQDDIYIPTVDTTQAEMSATEWTQGKTVSKRKLILLKHDDMIPLSLAPALPNKGSTRSMISKDPVKTESQKQDEFLDRWFQKAKEHGRGAEDDSDEEVKPRVAPDDDDW